MEKGKANTTGSVVEKPEVETTGSVVVGTPQPKIETPQPKPPVEPSFTEEELKDQVVFYSRELISALGNVYIGGHAAQVKDQLFGVLQKLKS